MGGKGLRRGRQVAVSLTLIKAWAPHLLKSCAEVDSGGPPGTKGLTVRALTQATPQLSAGSPGLRRPGVWPGTPASASSVVYVDEPGRGHAWPGSAEVKPHAPSLERSPDPLHPLLMDLPVPCPLRTASDTRCLVSWWGHLLVNNSLSSLSAFFLPQELTVRLSRVFPRLGGAGHGTNGAVVSTRPPRPGSCPVHTERICFSASLQQLTTTCSFTRLPRGHKGNR